MTLAAVLHFMPAAEADAVAAAFRRAIAPGSYLILSSGTSTGTSPALIERVQATYQDSAVVTGRTADEIAGYLANWDLLPPGLTDVWAWRPDSEWYWPPPPSARILGAVARKPVASRKSSGPETGGPTEHATAGPVQSAAQPVRHQHSAGRQ